ncbi:glycosyltransferase [Mesorhizobium marinum]|uniref:glycosyltransferase n=1 Tax=Mesorhizobium marinum TaxID=3228790 RepID=UPI003465A420
MRANLWVLSPAVIPWGRDHGAVRGLNRAMVRSSLVRFLKKAGFRSPEVWAYHPFVRDILDGIEIGTLSYHCVDDIAAIPGVDVARYEEAETEILKASDVVFVTAPPLAAKARKLNGNVHLVPNVVDPAHFATAMAPGPLPDDLARIPGPRLGFHGTLSAYKIDTDLLLGLAERRPDWQIILIGDEPPVQPGHHFAALRRMANVHFLGGKDYGDLPSYLRGMDVGLLPMRLNRYTASMYPMKYHEYLAGGVPVASTGLAFLQGDATFLEAGDGVEGFAVAVERQLRRGRLSAHEAAAAVGDNTWKRRQETMLEINAQTPARRGVAS